MNLIIILGLIVFWFGIALIVAMAFGKVADKMGGE